MMRVLSVGCLLLAHASYGSDGAAPVSPPFLWGTSHGRLWFACCYYRLVSFPPSTYNSILGGSLSNARYPFSAGHVWCVWLANFSLYYWQFYVGPFRGRCSRFTCFRTSMNVSRVFYHLLVFRPCHFHIFQRLWTSVVVTSLCCMPVLRGYLHCCSAVQMLSVIECGSCSSNMACALLGVCSLLTGNCCVIFESFVVSTQSTWLVSDSGPPRFSTHGFDTYGCFSFLPVASTHS